MAAGLQQQCTGASDGSIFVGRSQFPAPGTNNAVPRSFAKLGRTQERPTNCDPSKQYDPSLLLAVSAIVPSRARH